MSLIGGKRKVNKSLKAWVAFVKRVQKQEKLTYKDAIHRAKVRKDKGEKWMHGGNHEEVSNDSSMGMDKDSSMGMDKDSSMKMDNQPSMGGEEPMKMGGRSGPKNSRYNAYAGKRSTAKRSKRRGKMTKKPMVRGYIATIYTITLNIMKFI
jgi:hypothetical protein